jgi:hypothetical protein
MKTVKKTKTFNCVKMKNDMGKNLLITLNKNRVWKKNLKTHILL